MSQIRLYIDEDAMRGALVRSLRSRGFDVIAASEAGMGNRTDEAHLECAAGQNRVPYSFNTGDFVQLHTQWINTGRLHWGIVVATQQRYSIGEQVRRLARLFDSLAAEEMQNRIEFLAQW